MGKRIQWTAVTTVEYIPLPPEKEEAYWATMRYFASVMFGLDTGRENPALYRPPEETVILFEEEKVMS